MRLRFGKRQQPPSNAKRKSWHPPPSPPPADNPDPAFSPDPRSHPYHYLTTHEWALPLAPGHPSLQSPRRRRRRAVAIPRRPRPLSNDYNNQSDATESEIEIIQPPNSPVSTSSCSTSDSNNSAVEAATERTALAQTGRTSSIPPLPPTSMSVHPPSQAKEDVKPAKRFGFFTKRVFAKQDSSSRADDPGRTILIKPQGRRSEENGPSPAARLADNPALQRHKSAPGLHRPVQRDLRPALGEQNGLGSTSRELYPAGIGAVPSSLAAITAHHQDTASNARSQVPANLDKIDELDETAAIFGARLHHDGPYEAANRPVAEAGFTSKSRMPLGLDYGRLHQYHERTMKAVGHVYMPPEVPPGVPLNLKPGQVLPRNFRRQAGKPPRLRNNMVSPLPVEEEVEEDVSNPIYEQVVIPPRHANLSEIPFHKSQAGPKKPRPPRQLLRDNPLDGPPIDTSAIGLAMMTFMEDDDSPLTTPLPQPTPQQQNDPVEVEEYNPYAAENIEQPSPAAAMKSPPTEQRLESPPPAYTKDGHPQADVVSVMEFPTESYAVENSILRSLSPSESPHMDFAVRSLNGTSEETLVHDESSEGMEQALDPEAPHPVVDQEEAHSVKLEAILLQKSGRIVLGDRQLINGVRVASPAMAVETKATNSTPPQVSVTASKEPHSLEAQAVNAPQPVLAARYDKQLPPHPPSSPPLSDAHDQGLLSPSADTSAPTKSYPPSTAWKNSALQKAMAMHRDDLRRNTWSTTASQQSHTSTRVNDGHTPVPDTITTTSSSKLAPPAMMSRPSATMKSGAQDSLSTPLISRRDPIFNTDSLTRYPPPKPSLVSGSSTSPASGSSQEKRPYVIPAQRSRRNSTASSSAHSSILHTIHEEDSADPRPAPGLQRSQSSIQPRAMLQAKIQVGQVYPKDLQPSMPMVQRSVSQFTPNHRPPPAYTEDPQPSRTLSSEHRRRERKQAYADQHRQAYPMPGPHPVYVEDPQVTRAPSSDRRRREREQLQMDQQQQQRYPMPEPQPEIQVTNAGYDPRFPSHDGEKRERSQSRSSRGTHSSSSRSTPSSSRSGHSSSSTPQTTPDQDPRGGMSADPRAQYPAYPFRDVREMEESRAPSRQPSMGPPLSPESERRYMSDDRQALRAGNALSGVPEIDEGRSSHRQSYHQPYPERYPQGQPKQHVHLYPEIQDDRPYSDPRQGHQQPTEQYPRHQLHPYPQAEPLHGGIHKASTHAAEPSWKSEDHARPAGDPALLQPYAHQYPIQDNASSKPRSMNSSLTTSSVMPRYNPHLPKKLVMPAPLQAKSERVFNEVFDQPRPTPTPRKRRDKPSGTAMPRPGVQGTPSRTREPTPSLVPPLLGNGYEVDSSVSAGRKLKKRSSYVPPPPPAMSRLSPTKALNFAHPTVSAPSASEKATSHPVKSAPDKATKKVLSKRRTNL